MKQYDVRCPKCGAENKGLYLKETGGRMECIECGEVSRCRLRRCTGKRTAVQSFIQEPFPGAGMPSGQGA